MRLRRIAASDVLLVVEGSSDKSVLMRWLSPAVHVVPGSGKEQIVAARAFLNGNERARCTTLIDCDGVVSGEWLDDGDVVVTDMRDLEADLLSRFPLIDKLVSEFAWHAFQSKAELSQLAGRLQSFSFSTCTAFGIVKEAASAVGLSIGIFDDELGRRRRLRLSDLPESRVMETWPVPPTMERMLGLVGIRLGWNESDFSRLTEEESRRRLKLCSRHSLANCSSCAARTLANGHDLLDALWFGLNAMGAAGLNAKAVASGVRIAAVAPQDGWVVLDRLAKRSKATGYDILLG